LNSQQSAVGTVSNQLLEQSEMGGRPLLKGWRYVAFVGSIVGAISVAIYPIIIMPYMNPEPWQKQSKMVRSGSC
jgi:hypothetical protein